MTFLVWVASLGDDAGAADFRAGAGGGRHGDDRRDRRRRRRASTSRRYPRSPTAAGVWPGHEGDQLAGVERRAAAEGDDAVMAAGAEGGDAGLDIRLHRVGLARRRTAPREARPASRRSSVVCGDRQLGETRIGDEQRAGDARGAAGVGAAPRCGRGRSGWRSGSSSWRSVCSCRVPRCEDGSDVAQMEALRLGQAVVADFDSAPPRPVSLTPVQARCGSR